MTCAGADAAVIHREVAHPVELTAADVETFRHWSKYLLDGPETWTRIVHPPVTPAVRSAIWDSVRTDPGPSDPMVNYLLWKQSLDPTRFAHYHPKLAPALHRIELARSSPILVSQVSPTTTNSAGTTPAPSTPATNPVTSPQNLVPNAAPEPSMLLLAACMTGWAIGKLRRREPRRDA